MRILIADDEPIARSILREEVSTVPGLEIVAEAKDGLEAVTLINALRPELVFLDLQMPVMGGFEVISHLTAPSALVIVTAFDEHAMRAFDAGAIDYLVKPVRRDRLLRSIERVSRLRAQPAEAAEQARKISELAAASTGAKFRVIGRAGSEYFLLDSDEVLAFFAEQEAVWIVTAKHRYQSTHSLRAIEQRTKHLPFERVHRNAIVNVNHVRKMSALSSQRWLLTLSNGVELTVSKRQAQSVRRILNW